MSLKIAPFTKWNRPELKNLIEEFNKAPKENTIQRLFYLQKINYLINSTQMDFGLFQWLDANDAKGWHANLLDYGINPDGSFLFKGMQFARAVAQADSQGSTPIEQDSDTFYRLMQERDALLASDQPFEACKERFIAIGHYLNQFAEKDHGLKKNMDDHAQILSLAKDKISSVKGKTDLTSSAYTTEALGVKHVNNYNFKFNMKGWNDTLVFRVEDRSDLSFEQELHSYPVSKYFANDVALFMMQFKSEDDSEIEYKPVVLSQFAKQGSLLDVAKKLKGKPQTTIASQAKFYLSQINDFCLKLQDAKTYHPDIKLSNFLVHNNKLLVSDRKTFVRDANPTVVELRATPRYAPPQYVECLNDELNDYGPEAGTTHVDMQQMMSFQIGMALKEFLILTQDNELPENFSEPECTVLSHFQKPSRAIANLSLLVGELTRAEEGKRLSIDKLQRLMPFINHGFDDFYKRLESELPSSRLGIDPELNAINQLLQPNKLKRSEFQEQANAIFVAISERDPMEPRLNRMAEKLAKKCYKKYSEAYFSKISQAIETALLDKDWNAAPWYRKVAHVFTLGYYRVERETKISDISIKLDFNNSVFRTNFIPFEFLPSAALDSLGKIESTNFLDYFYTHFEEIRAQNSAQSSNSSSHNTPDQTRLHESIDPKGSVHNAVKKVVINTTDTEENAPEEPDESASMIIKADVVKQFNIAPPPNEEESQTPSGTMKIIKEKASDTQKSTTATNALGAKSKAQEKQTKRTSVLELPENHRFFTAFGDEEAEDHPKRKRRSIRKVGSTLFRGERRPGLQGVFNPPTNENEDASVELPKVLVQ